MTSVTRCVAFVDTMRRVTARVVTASRGRTTKPSTRAVRRVIASMSSSASSPNADDKESELRQLWATSYDGWIDAPGASESTIYLRPAKNDADVREASGFGDVPPIARTQYLFAVTAHNPMGVETLAERNRRANDALLKDLKRIPNATATWESFGFSAEWREDGYVCAFEDWEEGRETMVAIAKKYAQGAIYAYEAHAEFPWALRRRTVSAAMSDAVDADVIVVRCEEPPFVKR